MVMRISATAAEAVFSSEHFFTAVSQATVTLITRTQLFFCYGESGRDVCMHEDKLHREQRVPVGPNRLGRLIEVVTAAVFVFILIYLLR